MQQLSPAGYALLKEFESCKLTAYPDPKTGGAPWTCGWGATGPGIEKGTVWTQSQADQRLVADVCRREDMVRQSVAVPLTQGQFDAMVSIVFNVGHGTPDQPNARGKDGIIVLRTGKPSTLLRKLNTGEYTEAGQEFEKWVSPGTNVENGLRRRRLAELALWNSKG